MTDDEILSLMCEADAKVPDRSFKFMSLSFRGLHHPGFSFPDQSLRLNPDIEASLGRLRQRGLLAYVQNTPNLMVTDSGRTTYERIKH